MEIKFGLNILVLIMALIFGLFGAWLIAYKGRFLGLIDNPNKRSSHLNPTPKGGGIGIVFAFVFASVCAGIGAAFWIPACVIALFSLLVDRVDLSPKIRLLFQFLAAISLLLLAYPLLHAPYSLPITVFLAVFIVGTANIYNFMDGIDGIAAITGIVGFGLLSLFLLVEDGEKGFALLSSCIAFSCLGFLPFNMPKAKVFMGDVGSILLGFSFAAIVVIVSKSILDFACLAGFLFLFYADELTTMAARIKHGENLLKPHRRHLYQLLANEKRIPHWKISISYGLVQLIIGITILLLRPFGLYVVLLLLAVFFLAFVMVSSAVRKNLERFPKPGYQIPSQR